MECCDGKFELKELLLILQIQQMEKVRYLPWQNWFWSLKEFIVRKLTPFTHLRVDQPAPLIQSLAEVRSI